MRILTVPFIGIVAAIIVSGGPIVAQTGAIHQEATVEEADVLYEAFRYSDAVRIYEKLLQSDSTDFHLLTQTTQTWNFEGLDLQAAERKDSAELAFERSASFAEQTRRAYPDSVRTYVNLAAAYGNLGLFRGGKSKVRMGRMVEGFCDEALRIDSTDTMALTILGVFNRELSKLNWLERLVAKALYGRIPKGSIEKSADYLQRAIATDSMMVFPNYSLAVTYERMNRDEAALRQYERVIHLKPANSEEARYLEKAKKRLAESRSEELGQ